VGNTRASDGRPGSIDSQVEQTLARGKALRPESARATEVVKERIEEVVMGRGGAMERAGGIVGTREAGQLVKATRSTKASIGSVVG